MKTTTLPLRHSMNLSRVRLALLVTVFVLTCFALSPATDAQCPQICDSGLQNTALGVSALINNTTGSVNTAIGYYALGFNTTGYGNTASGYYALGSNRIGYRNTATGDGALTTNSTGNDNTANGYYA